MFSCRDCGLPDNGDREYLKRCLRECGATLLCPGCRHDHTALGCDHMEADK